jgi:hypothetical protein
MAFFWAPRCSWIPSVLGAEVDDAQDGSRIRCLVALLYLAAKPGHVGIYADGLACPLHHPMACGHQTRGQVLLSGAVLIHHCSGRWCLSEGCEAPRLGYLVEC